MRGRHLHRRSRPGRGARARAQEGRDARHQGDLRRGSPRGVRARFRLPHVPGERALRGRLSARHLDRQAPDRQAPDRDRQGDRRRRRCPWRHGQGQRPGALRAHLLCAQPRHQGDRALAGMGLQVAQRPDRVRREAPDPGRQGQARRGAVLGRRQSAALLLGRESAGGPGARAAALRLSAHHRARGRAGQGDDRHHRLRQGRSDLHRRQETLAGRACSRG